ncbi:MAG: hypothetical protein HQ592_10230 [Planctomycetes bacterium]|nr:hypothetical protein [Planctomycetota bacterium]
MDKAIIGIIRKHREKGSVLILFALSMLALIGLAALAVDLGAVYTAQAQLQVGADAAALAAIQELESGQAHYVGAQFAALNSVLSTSITLSESDVTTGKLDFATGDFTAGAQPANAVRVTARRTPGAPDGPLELFFGKAIGHDSVSIQAESIAAIDGRISGIDPASSEAQFDLLPFAVDINDVGRLETLDGTPIEGEELPQAETRFVADVGQTIDFYPYTDNEAPGNFGLVSLDGYSNGASTISEWVENGYPARFTIPPAPGYIELNGCPGMTTSIKQAVNSRIGDTVLVTVYDNLTGQGDNVTYRVPYFLAVEIVDEHLTGAPLERYIRATIKDLYTTNVVIDPSAPEHASLGVTRIGK